MLTGSGAAIVRAAHATHTDGVRRHFLGRFSAVELDTLRAFLARLGEDPSLEDGQP